MSGVVFRRNFPFYLFMAVLIAAFGFYFYQGKKEKDLRKKSLPKHETAESGRQQKLERFNLTGFDDKGQKFWNLQGQTAKIDPGKTIFLDENVTLRLRDNTLIRTDKVQWSQDGGTMRTDSPVFVDHEAVRVKGVGAIGRPSESFIQLNRRIEMLTNQSSKLTCLGPMKIYYDQNKMVFYRKVKITDQRGTLSANRMDVFFEPDQKKVGRIIAQGGVLIQRGADTTRSSRAIYTVSTGAIRLEGNPEITVHNTAAGKGLLEQAAIQK